MKVKERRQGCRNDRRRLSDQQFKKMLEIQCDVTLQISIRFQNNKDSFIADQSLSDFYS